MLDDSLLVIVSIRQYYFILTVFTLNYISIEEVIELITSNEFNLK